MNKVILYLIIINFITFCVYKYDKTNAQLNGPSKELKHYRISENKLHALSIFGGWPAAFIAQQYMRHKTIKQPFQSIFIGTIICNIFLSLLIYNFL